LPCELVPPNGENLSGNTELLGKPSVMCVQSLASVVAVTN